MKWTNQDVKNVIEEIMKRSAQDKEFRDLALNDVKKALQEVAPTKEIPEKVTLKFVENNSKLNDNEKAFILPPLSGEIDDELLAGVTGGSCIVNSCTQDSNSCQDCLLDAFNDAGCYVDFGDSCKVDVHDIGKDIGKEIKDICIDLW